MGAPVSSSSSLRASCAECCCLRCCCCCPAARRAVGRVGRIGRIGRIGCIGGIGRIGVLALAVALAPAALARAPDADADADAHFDAVAPLLDAAGAGRKAFFGTPLLVRSLAVVLFAGLVEAAVARARLRALGPTPSRILQRIFRRTSRNAALLWLSLLALSLVVPIRLWGNSFSSLFSGPFLLRCGDIAHLNFRLRHGAVSAVDGWKVVVDVSEMEPDDAGGVVDGVSYRAVVRGEDNCVVTVPTTIAAAHIPAPEACRQFSTAARCCAAVPRSRWLRGALWGGRCIGRDPLEPDGVLPRRVSGWMHLSHNAPVLVAGRGDATTWALLVFFHVAPALFLAWRFVREMRRLGNYREHPDWLQLRCADGDGASGGGAPDPLESERDLERDLATPETRTDFPKFGFTLTMGWVVCDRDFLRTQLAPITRCRTDEIVTHTLDEKGERAPRVEYRLAVWVVLKKQVLAFELRSADLEELASIKVEVELRKHFASFGRDGAAFAKHFSSVFAGSLASGEFEREQQKYARMRRKQRRRRSSSSSRDDDDSPFFDADDEVRAPAPPPPPREPDYYAVLGVPRCASPAEVRWAYRRLAIKNHPDKNRGDVSATQRFQEINEAYQILGDPALRAQFDARNPLFGLL